jgi:hypothetical protein
VLIWLLADKPKEVEKVLLKIHHII